MNIFRCFGLLLLFFWCGTLCGQAPTEQQKRAVADTMIVRYDHSPIYDSASYTAGIIGDMQGGESVVVIGKSGKFARVQLPSGAGFIAMVNLQEITGTQPKPPKKLKNEKAATDTTQNSSNPSATPGSKARQQPVKHQCKGLTKSGKQCSRNAEEGSEYCWQHHPDDGATDGKENRTPPRRKP